VQRALWVTVGACAIGLGAVLIVGCARERQAGPAAVASPPHSAPSTASSAPRSTASTPPPTDRLLASSRSDATVRPLRVYVNGKEPPRAPDLLVVSNGLCLLLEDLPLLGYTYSMERGYLQLRGPDGTRHEYLGNAPIRWSAGRMYVSLDALVAASIEPGVQETPVLQAGVDPSTGALHFVTTPPSDRLPPGTVPLLVGPLWLYRAMADAR